MQQQYGIVPKATMQRYPIYLKALRKLHSQNINRVLSSELSELVNIAATTIRRDLSFIGCLGKQGYGYDVEKLIQVFNEKLGTGFDEKIILIGVGNLGHALLNYNRWNYVVGEIVMAFEIDEKLIGSVQGIPVYHIDQLEEKIPKDCRIAILTASTDIQNVVDSVPKGMILKEIDIVANIQELVFETNTLKKFK